MNIATLRIEGDDAGIVTLKNTVPLFIDAQWLKGVPESDGTVNDSSGLNANIADTESSAELMQLVRLFLAQCQDKNLVFTELGLNAGLSIGFSVGDAKQFTTSVQFDSSELEVLVKSGLTLEVAAYPTSDEANS